MILPGWAAAAKNFPWRWIGIGALILAICGLLVDRHFTRSALIEAQADLAAKNIEIAALRLDAAAKETAAVERETDNRKIDMMKKELTDAIASVPPGIAPGPATMALGCERLRRAGTRPADLPAACRPAR